MHNSNILNKKEASGGEGNVNASDFEIENSKS